MSLTRRGRLAVTLLCLTAAVATVCAVAATRGGDRTGCTVSGHHLSLAQAAGSRGVDGATRQALAAAMSGRAEGVLSCHFPAARLRREGLGPDGLTPRAENVRHALEQTFGPQSLGGFAPGGVHSGHVEGSAHYEGRAIDVFFRPVTAAHTQEGWREAQWLVAHASQLHLDTVIFDAKIWSRDHGRQGWRTYHPPEGPTTNPILLHLDHVHVDVQRGR